MPSSRSTAPRNDITPLPDTAPRNDTAPAAGDDLSCGYCGQTNSRRLYASTTTERDQFTFRRCRECEAIYLAPRPSVERLAQAYDSSYYGPGDRKFIAPIERIIDEFRLGRARRVAKGLAPGSRILDIGCGNGGFLHGLARLGYEAHGVELPGESGNRAAKLDDITVHLGSLEESPYVGEQFDAVTMWHVIEHLTEPRKTLVAIADMLSTGGRFHVSLPNVDSWQCRLFRGNWLHHDPPRHLFYLGPDELTREVEELGFRRTAITFQSLEQNPFGWLQSLLNHVEPTRDALFESLKGNTTVAAAPHRIPLGVQKALFYGTYPLFAALAAVEAAAGRGGTMELTFERVADR